MKRGYGMYLFLLSWYFLSQTTDIHYLPIMAHQKWVIFKLLQDMNCPIFVGQFKEKWWGFLHRKAHCVTIFSYDQFQLISLFINDFSIMTNNDVDRANVCLYIILLQKCKKNAKKCRWSAFTSKYIAQKMKGKQYVPLERKKKSSLTPAIWDPSTYHEYDIHKLLTLLFYSTYTILKLIPALRYASPPSPMPYVLQILNKFDLQLYKTYLKITRHFWCKF